MLIFTCNFNSVMKIWGFFFQGPFLKVDFNKYTTQWHMGHSRDDDVHKIPHKMKTHWQNQLKSVVLVYHIVPYRIRHKKIDALLVPCPFKGAQSDLFNFLPNFWRFWYHMKVYIFLIIHVKFHGWKVFRLEEINENVSGYGNHNHKIIKLTQ